jgi:hypothetical protein
MSGWDDRPTEISAPPRLASLPPAERTVLAALAVVGRASLSGEELAALVEVADATPLVEDLERRGLLRREGKRRYSLVGRIGADIRKLNETVETGERLIGYVETLARGGKLTAARLEEDAEAILGLAGWTAEVRRWETLLELVKTVQASFGLAHRVYEQRVLLELGRTAAANVGDRAAELFCLEQLERVAAELEDAAAGEEFAAAAKELRRGLRRGVASRTALRVLALVAVGAAGAAGGVYAGRHGNGTATTVLSRVTVGRVSRVTVNGNGRTVVSRVTVTRGGQTVTTTVAQQGRTVTTTVRSVSTVVQQQLQTVTTTVQSVTTALVPTTVTEPTTVVVTVTTTPTPALK